MTVFPKVSDARRREMLTDRPGPVRVLIDTDAANEIDDQFALAWAVLSPERIDIEAVVAEPYGHLHMREPLIAATEELERGRRLEIDQPVHALGAPSGRLGRRSGHYGSDRPGRGHGALLRRDRERVPQAGRTLRGPGVARGRIGTCRPPMCRWRARGARRIVEAALADDERVLHIAAIGAVTNIASALLMAPEIAARMVVTWTSGYPTWTGLGNRPSLNLVQDPHASRLLFDSGVPMVYLPGFHVGAQLRFSLPEMEAWIRGKGEIGDYLFHLYTNNPIHIQRGVEPFPGQSWGDLGPHQHRVADRPPLGAYQGDGHSPARRPALLEAARRRAGDARSGRRGSGCDLPRPDRQTRRPGENPGRGRRRMRAAVLHPGGGLAMEDRPAPSPGPGQILVAPRLVGICGSDLHYYQGRPHRRLADPPGPHVLGHEFTGVVAEVGPQVDSAAVGDRIAVEPIIPCGGCGACRRGLYNVCPHIRFTGSPHTDGALQELVAVPARGAHHLPAGMPSTLGAWSSPHPSRCMRSAGAGSGRAKRS